MKLVGPLQGVMKSLFYFMEKLKKRFLAIGLTEIAFKSISHYPLNKIENYLIVLEEDYYGRK